MQDSRHYFVLPQSPEEAAYYSYGTPGAGKGQYAHPQMLTFLLLLEHRWGGIDNRKIGIGNISLADGKRFAPHRSHRNGLQVDIRPLRKDGQPLPVSYFEAEYDRQGTKKLIDLMLQTGMVKWVAFNDPQIHVKRMPGHDNHLHVEVKI